MISHLPPKKVQQNIYTKNIFDFDPVRVPILIVCNLQVGVKIEENKKRHNRQKWRTNNKYATESYPLA